MRSAVQGGWSWLWLPCAAIRIGSSVLYWNWASIHSAREHLEGEFDTNGDGHAPTPLFTPLLYLAIHFTAIFHYSAACPSDQIDAFDTRGDGKPDAFDTNGDGQIDQTVSR